MLRSSSEVAVQAVIYGTLGFRASLEITKHPRSATLCPQLLPWLEEQGFGGRLDEFKRQILETPHGELPRESQTEAFWRGEAASFLGWAVQLFDRPDPNQPVDFGVLIERLRILDPDASDLVSNVTLRPEHEIEDYCAFCVKVRHELQRSSLERSAHDGAGTGMEVLTRLHQARLTELGLNDAVDRQQGLEIDLARLISDAPRARGFYTAMAMESEWLLGQSSIGHRST